ncbi:MAG: hypothetical protein Q7U54_20720, partial [Bacteroidales bacterium]|nr:hypothetical protein [Bacteroidales bacterium]
TALHSWSNYVSAVERGYVLAENSIIYPVSEFIGTKSGLDEIWLDRVHPNLSGKRFDLRFFAMLDAARHEVAMEFKYARQGYTEGEGEKQRILNDILRLKVFTESKSNRKAYFLICGEQIDFFKAFQSIGWTTKIDKDGRPFPSEMGIEEIKDLGIIKPHGFYANWFRFDPESSAIEKNIDFAINDNKSVPEEYLEGFYKEYEESFKDGMNRKIFESSKVRTRLVYISDLSNLEGIKKLMRVGIWEISNV